MQSYEIIKKYFDAANSIVISQMYLREFLKPEDLSEDSLKSYNPGHLGTSMSINFILANLNYFLKKHNLNSQLVIGTGHAGVSLITNSWLNGTLEKHNQKYTRNKQGLNNLIDDFGKTIRSEINPQYPETIYDGGELGYSLGVAYGYAINSKVDLVPCIIGDGEAETGTIMSSWQLNKILKTKSKVLPIINLNGLKMGSTSFLSQMSDNDLKNYFISLGYEPIIIDSTQNENVNSIIENMQISLTESLEKAHPLIIFKSYKGFTLPKVNNNDFENTINVHKNPLQNIGYSQKIKIIREFLKIYNIDIFDENDNLLPQFKDFEIESPDRNLQVIKKFDINKENSVHNMEKLENYLLSFFIQNKGLIFSPDEIYSNKLGKVSEHTLEILNENLLQALYQGYVQAGNVGFYISYEGFMPIIGSMITQYYKYLKQKSCLEPIESTHSLNYILTSTCWENTYSHQNPDFVNALLEKNDLFYNVLYPKDGNSLMKCIDYSLGTKDKINVITTSKRHSKKYQTYDEADIRINVVLDCAKPDLILCATGDYMLDQIFEVYEKIKNEYPNIRIVYVTKPQILSIESKEALTPDEFTYTFGENIPIVYLFSGYSSIIKSLIYNRHVDCTVLGYNDEISTFGNLEGNLHQNGLSEANIISICKNKIITNDKVMKLG